MYGENLGTVTLSESLVQIARRIARRRDDGYPADEDMAYDARCLMEGAMVLWLTIMEEVHE
jgi:hypothetical protein